jgi:hypothetical protein
MAPGYDGQSLAVFVGTPNEAQSTNVGTLPCEQLSIAQDAFKTLRVPRGTFDFDHLIDRAAGTCHLGAGHDANMRPFGTHR